MTEEPQRTGRGLIHSDGHKEPAIAQAKIDEQTVSEFRARVKFPGLGDLRYFIKRFPTRKSD